MGVGVQVDARLSALLRALGALGPDGQFDPSWFSHPLDAIRHCLDDDSQRAAVFDLLGDTLPPVTGPLVPAGASWHPLLADNKYGNVYVTVEDGVIGAAAVAGTAWTDLPSAELTIRLPLLRTGNGPAQAEVGPLEISVVVSLDAAEGITSAGIRVLVGIDGSVSVVVRLEDAAGTVTQFDPAAMNADAVRAIELLVRSVLAYETGTHPAILSLITHLPGILGIGDTALTPFPLAEPAAVRGWLAGIAGTPAALQAWFAHVAGVLSAATAAAGVTGGPQVSGAGTAARPLRSPVVTADGFSLELLMAAGGTAAQPTLMIGVALSTPAGPGTLTAQAFVAAIPLAGSAPAAVLPSAAALLTVPVSGGTVQGGAGWDGTSIVPVLRLDQVEIAGTPETVDLTDARAVAAAASETVLAALTSAIGADGIGRALLALVGFVPPDGDPTSPHTIGASALTGNLLTAIAEVHRGALDDPGHPWSRLFAEIGSLFGLTAQVSGEGTRQSPWLLRLAGDDTFSIALAAWDDRTGATPAGEHLLRIGLHASASPDGWTLGWSTEVLAFDLAPATPARIALVGAQNLTLEFTRLPAIGEAGFSAWADGLGVTFHWVPGLAAAVSVGLTGLYLEAGGTSAGPLDLRLPGTPDPARPGVGLPVDPDDLVRVLDVLLTRAWSLWGGDLRAYAIAGLLGLHSDLAGLPDDWPQLLPASSAELSSLLSNPVGALAGYVRSVATGVCSDGSAFAPEAAAWLAALVAGQLPAEPGFAPGGDLSGAGTHDDPWLLPAGSSGADLLAWLEPGLAAWPDPGIAAAASGQALLAALPGTTGALYGRDLESSGSRLDELDAWLASGDGLVPYDSQVAAPAAWAAGTPLAVRHDAAPSDPSAISQAAAQLAAWGHPAALLLVTASAPQWQAMVAGIAPGNDPDARVDLRGQPEADLSGLATVAGAYVVYLDDPAPSSAGLASLVTQIGRAAGRVSQLTGGPVALIGHGPGGVAARVAAAQAPAGIAGVITICAPHGGSDLTPLSDPAAADAVRLASALGDSDAVSMLRAILDGGPAAGGVLPPASTYAADTFAGPPGGLTDTLPGLAIGSQLPAGLVAALAAACAAGTSAPAPAATTHAALGGRITIPAPSGAAGTIHADLSLRADLARFRVGTGPEPARSAHEITLTARLHRPGGWLVGDGGDRADANADASRAVLRARWAEIAVTIGADSSGRLTVTPSVELHDAGRPGESAATLTLDDIMTALATQPDALAVPAALDGSAGDFVRSCLAALDLTDGTGALSVPALRGLVAAPAAYLGPQLGALLTVIGPAAGATPAGGGWQLPVLAGTQILAITPGPWTLRLTTAAPQPADATPAALLAGLTVDASLTLPGFATSGTAALAIGALALSTDGRSLSLALPPWLPSILLAPGGDPETIAAVLAAAIPRALVSAALGVFAGPLLGSGLHTPPLDQLVLSPGSTLLGMLGDGHGFTAAKVNALLGMLGSALGLIASGGTTGGGTTGGGTTTDGLTLPGGLLLHTADPFTLHLSGTLDMDGAGIGFDLGLALPADQPPAPDGTVTLTLPLPGTWGTVAITFGVAESGVTLSVQPSGAAPIAILPHFDGLAALAEGAQTLLPHLLQQLVTELSPPGEVLSAVLDVAGAMGIYSPAAGGFDGSAQSAALAAMIQPGWLASVAGSGEAIATHLAALFGPAPLLPVPLGSIAAAGGTVTWTVPLPGGAGAITASLGWDSAGQPVVTLTASAVPVGPVVIDLATITVGAQLAADVTAHLAFDGILAPVTPAIAIGLDSGRFTAQILPLGHGTSAQIALTLAPALGFTATDDGAVQLALQWGLPLATEVILLAVNHVSATPALLDRPFWNGGPKAHDMLAGAGLIPATGAPALIHPLPDPVDAVLGALAAAATGVSVNLTSTLTLSLVRDATTGRTGVRLSGYQDIGSAISVRFGTKPWLTDPGGGVTLWLVEPAPAGTTPSLRVVPGLDVTGLGVVLSGDPLVDGSLVIGGAGGLLFFSSTFLNAAGAPALRVTDIGAGAVLTSSYVALSGGDGDSFIAKVLPPSLQAPFDLVVAYRDGKLEVGGTGPAATDDIELAIPLDLDLVVIQITELLLGMLAGGNALSLEAALSGNADVGPLYAAVKRVGIIATFGAGGAGLRFRPPDQVSLSIDTPTLRIGGFLLVDSDHGRYIGGIEITVLDTFELTAIGIITTRMPDGSPGFSLLFIISMKLPVPIALGYGFFFAGAGGLLGIDRAIDLDALAAGLRTGAAESILFPQDIARNADAIIRDLETVFPIQQGQFLVGPMAMITWMSPPLITIELGLVLDIGTPLKIAIIGLLRAALPDPDEPVLDLKVAFVGAIDLGTSLLRFDASIYDSYIGMDDFKISLDGDIAVRLGWGPQPDFVSALGGFHPAYHPASYLHLPAMRRITLTLLRDNPSLVLTAYFAITANSVQFGTRLDFSYSVSGFSIVGDFGFDVLLQLVPFGLDAEVQASLAVQSGGSTILSIDMDFHLTGPTPWIARGTASFKILFFSVGADFKVQFGTPLTNALAYVAALPALLAALADPAAWSGELASATGTAVSLLQIDPGSPAIVIDAAGVLTISQRVLPLATDITMFGTSKPNDVSRIEIGSLTLGGAAQAYADATEMFSPAAYQALSDDDKLKDASFVPRPSGARATAGTALHTDYALARPGTFDLIIAADDGTESRTPDQQMDQALLGTFARGGATGKSAASRALRAQREQGVVAGVGKPADAYAVNSVSDLRARAADGTVAAVTGTGAGAGFAAGVLTDRYTAEQRARAAGAGYQVVPASQVVTP